PCSSSFRPDQPVNSVAGLPQREVEDVANQRCQRQEGAPADSSYADAADDSRLAVGRSAHFSPSFSLARSTSAFRRSARARAARGAAIHFASANLWGWDGPDSPPAVLLFGIRRSRTPS